jgi:inosine/xanthosine triphosphate pyrophosphatase family protein
MNNTNQSLPSIFNRQPDTQFQQLTNLIEAARVEKEGSKQYAIAAKGIKFVDNGGNLAIDSADVRVQPGRPLTHYSLMQASRMAKLDTDVIRRLFVLNRRDLAIENLNVLFPRDYAEMKMLLLDPQQRVRALNGGDYSRLWDHDMFAAVDSLLVKNGFVPAVSTRGTGSLLSPGQAALFRGDQTSFGFFFSNDQEMKDYLGGMQQGIMVWNSEVGARSFGYNTFYFRQDSGTFLVGDIRNDKLNRFVHRGNIHKGFREFLMVLAEASEDVNSRREADLQTFQSADQTPFAASDDEAIERLNKMFDMTIGQAQAVVKAARLPENGGSTLPHLTVWQVSLGIAWESAQTSRAESMVDDSMMATKVLRRCVK